MTREITKHNSADAAQARKNMAKDAGRLIADARNDITIPFFSTVLQPIDDTLIQRGGGKGLKLYDEIERDTEAWSVLQKRKKVLLSREWTVEAGGEEQADLDAAEFISEQFGKLPFDRICEELLDATLKGFSISEIVWARDGNRIIPSRIVSHDQRRFVFDPKWEPRLLTLANMNDGMPLPVRKFIVHRHGVKGNNPYGLGLGTRLFWPVLFKREGVAFWLTFLDKFASPTVVGKTPYGMLDEDNNKLLNMLASIAQRSAITVPTGTDLDFLEAARSGSVSYQDWCEYWDKQMSICVLGETLTTDIGSTGSRAASETHEGILQMLVDADSDLLSDTLHATLIQWMVDYNFPGAKAPSCYRERPQDEIKLAEAKKKKSDASVAENKALMEAVSIAARFDDDDEARAYITTFAPCELEEDMVKTLVANREQLAKSSSPAPIGHNGGPALDDPSQPVPAVPENPKKKDDPLEEEAAHPAFAEREDVEASLSDKLDAATADRETAKLNAIRNVFEAADTYMDAVQGLLDLQAGRLFDVTPIARALQAAFEVSALFGREAVLGELAGDLLGQFADDDGVDVFSQPFREQIDFFRQKETRPSKAWDDVLRGDHDRAFMVAGAKDRAMLQDFHQVIAKAMEEGTTLEAFRADFDAIVARYGWSYKGSRGWRTRIIFETNLRTSYMAGRLKQMRDPAVIKHRPYWQYVHGMTRKPKVPRRQHQAWDGMILRHDDRAWEWMYPPNDWQCSCGVRTLSERDLKRMGKNGPDQSPARNMKPQIDKRTGKLIEVPEGIGQGWDYMPGEQWVRGLVPSAVDKVAAKSVTTVDKAVPVADLAASGKPLKARELPSGKKPEYYAGKFLAAFGLKPGERKLFTDKAGGRIMISDDLLRDARGELKTGKRGRDIHMAQLAETIADPDEIWIGVAERIIPEDQGGGTERVLDRKYIRIDPKTGLLAIFELFENIWTGKTAFAPKDKRSVRTDIQQIDKRRSGKLLYRRGQNGDD